MNAPVATMDRPAPIVEFKASLDQREEQFKAALPAHIPVERFMRVVLTAVQRNHELLDCDRRSLFNAAMIAAAPDLYVALSEVVAAFDANSGRDVLGLAIDKAAAALRRARGEG